MSSSSSTALDVVYMHMDNFEIRTTHNEEVTSTGWSCGCRTLNITHNAKLWGQKLEIKVSNLSTCVIERERQGGRVWWGTILWWKWHFGRPLLSIYGQYFIGNNPPRHRWCQRLRAIEIIVYDELTISLTKYFWIDFPPIHSFQTKFNLTCGG